MTFKQGTDDLNPIYGGPGVHKTHSVSFYDTLRRIRHENLEAESSEVYPLYKEAVLRDEELLDAVVRYSFINAWNSIEGITKRRAEKRMSPKERAAQQKRIQKAVAKVKAVLILNYLMPNGKIVRECTFGYLRTVGGKFKQLGMAGKPAQIVGSVLADKQAEAIWRKG